MLNIIQLPQRGYINNIVRSAMKLWHQHSTNCHALPQWGNVNNIVHSAMHRKASEESALKGRWPVWSQCKAEYSDQKKLGAATARVGACELCVRHRYHRALHDVIAGRSVGAFYYNFKLKTSYE